MILLESKIKNFSKNNNKSESRTKLKTMEEARSSLQVLIGYLKHQDTASIKAIDLFNKNSHIGWRLRIEIDGELITKEFIKGGNV